MMGHLYSMWNVTVRLEREEEFTKFNDDGNQFFVNAITYSGNDYVGITGPAKKVNGERGYINRYGRMPFDDLSPEIQTYIRNCVNGRNTDARMHDE